MQRLSNVPVRITGTRKSRTPRIARSLMVGACLLIAAPCLPSFPPLLFPAVHAELLDHIVAAVNNEAITESELAQAVALNVRFGRPGMDRKNIESETLEGLITRCLLVQEARRLKFIGVSEQETSGEIEKLKQRFGSDSAFSDFMKEHDLSLTELARMLGEQLLAQKFIKKKIVPFVRITRESAQSYFDAHRSEFPGRQFADVQKNIIARLTDDKIGQQLDQYVAELRSRADIRINPS
ncbi:MAG TPA: SurA N-terminal domain-containing protein [Nitrospirota bacterium]|nr:SurA N-terminal domain-containing protein [Nitrospirota bacterium]